MPLETTVRCLSHTCSASTRLGQSRIIIVLKTADDWQGSNNVQDIIHTPTLPTAPLIPIGLATPLSPESVAHQCINMPGKGRLVSTFAALFPVQPFQKPCSTRSLHSHHLFRLSDDRYHPRRRSQSRLTQQGSPAKPHTRRPSQTRNTFPTPLSMSPSLPRSSNSQTSLGGAHRLPPAFDHASHPHSRYSTSHTTFSPYRPGEYSRSERGIASERTKIAKVERKLFDDDKSRSRDDIEGEELSVPEQAKKGSSPLAPPFEAKMVLRNGASVDLISW